MIAFPPRFRGRTHCKVQNFPCYRRSKIHEYSSLHHRKTLKARTVLHFATMRLLKRQKSCTSDRTHQRAPKAMTVLNFARKAPRTMTDLRLANARFQQRRISALRSFEAPKAMIVMPVATARLQKPRGFGISPSTIFSIFFLMSGRSKVLFMFFSFVFHPSVKRIRA